MNDVLAIDQVVIGGLAHATDFLSHEYASYASLKMIRSRDQP